MSDVETNPAPGAPAGMLCPRCRVDLMMSDRQGIEIDYCPKCRGVWLDRGELDKIIERSAQYSAAPPQQASPASPPVQSPWMAPDTPPPGHAPANPPPAWESGYDPHYQGGHGGEHGGGYHGGGHGGDHERSRRGGHSSFLRRLFD